MTFDQTKQFFKIFGESSLIDAKEITHGAYQPLTIEDLYQHFQNRMTMERQPNTAKEFIYLDGTWKPKPTISFSSNELGEENAK